MEVNKIICGDTKTELSKLPDESVNCVCTSPPYWGLRDYGIEPVIWDGDKDCKNEWMEDKTAGDIRFRGKGSIVGNNRNSNIYPIKHRPDETNPGKEGWYKDKGGLSKNPLQSSFCLKCGAWRGSLGLEPTFELYIKHLCDIFNEVKRVLRKDGTCWVNLGDTYGGSGNRKGHTLETSNLNRLTVGYGATEGNQKATKGYEKSLLMIPQRFAIEMVNRGWILRNTIIWHKPNCMPSSAKDRFTVDFEYVYFFVKSKKYWFEQQFEKQNDKELEYRTKLRSGKKYNCKKPYQDNTPYINLGWASNKTGYNPKGRNKRAVWTIPTKPFPEAHFAVYPEKLIEPMIKAGCPKGGVVLDPFSGAGTTAVVAKKQGKKYIGIEIKQEYVDMANKRIRAIPETLF